MHRSKFESDIKNLKGTFAIEGFCISDETYKKLKRMASGKTTYSEIIDELIQKYNQRV